MATHPQESGDNGSPTSLIAGGKFVSIGIQTILEDMRNE